MNAGIHYPNARFRNMDRFNSINWSGIVLLHYQRADLPQLRLRYPQARILVRGYLPNWYSTDPVAWAQEVAGWTNENRSYGIEITYANEQNLKAEGHPLAAGDGNGNYPPRSVYEDIAEWNSKVLAELRRLCPGVKIHFPALAQGHSDDWNDAGYVGFEILRKVVEAHDVLDGHTYWTRGYVESPWYGRRYEKLHALFLGMPIDLTECGSIDMTPSEVGPWLAGLPSYIRGNAWYIWDSDDGNLGWYLNQRSDMVQALEQSVTPLPTPPPLPPPSSDGWCPFATKRPLQRNFTAGRHGHRAKAVCIHIAQGTLTGLQSWFDNPAAQVSAHFCIGKKGEIEQYVSINDMAWANGIRWSGTGWTTPKGMPIFPTWTGLEPGVNPNDLTVSIEHEGMAGEPMTRTMADAQYRLLGWLAGQLRDAAGHLLIFAPHQVLIGHNEINPTKVCPGPTLTPEIVVANMMRPR